MRIATRPASSKKNNMRISNAKAFGIGCLICWMIGAFIMSPPSLHANPFAHYAPMPQASMCPGSAPPVAGSSGTGGCVPCNGSAGGGGACVLNPPPGTASPPATSCNPVYFHLGAQLETVTDFQLSAPGLDGSTSRSRFAGNSGGVFTNGWYWLNNTVDVYLYQQVGNINLIAPNGGGRLFIPSGSSFISPDDSYLVLTHDTTNQEYVLTDKAKTTLWRFYDFTVSNTSLYGSLKEQSTLQLKAQGKSGFVYSYNTDGTLNQITSPTGQDYSIVYTWNALMITKIEYKDASGNLIGRIEYTYYDDVVGPSSDLGGTKNLVQVKVSKKATKDAVGTLSVVRYTQYRYTSDRQNIKAVYEHDAIMRMVGNLSGISAPEDLLTKADTYGSPPINEFANRSFTYYTASTSTASINTPFATGENLNSTYGGSEYNEYGYVKTETIGGCGG